jgi:hypothetical protein
VTFIHLTEATAPGTGGSHQQKGGGLLAIAFPPVWTAAFFADGMNLTLFNNLLNGGNIAGAADRPSQPRGERSNLG